ncbi:MAG TPA: hypothetical protein VFI91_09660 [Longimicrobiaceae bacterium]|nr:hypothetical protein [Longimicrobiaceae bacterium]
MSAQLDSTFLSSFEWRSIGPANMSGRITDIEGVPGTSTFYVASAAGGIWKTINNGTTFRPLFQNERVISMGDIAIAPSDTSIIWAGTGEEDSRNSISPGGGIYKSTDGGLTWELMGLEETQTIGRIVIHPNDPNTVWVAAMGATWATNPERGLYKTTDGGETWELVKFISDRAGFIDIAMHPNNPDVLFAASWERIRGPWFFKSGGPGSGLWKSTDGGESWMEVEGGGFPETNKGRIGLAISESNPNVIYALTEAEEGDTEGMTDEEAAQSGQKGTGLYRSDDGGETWTWMNGEDTRPFYYSQVRVDPSDPNYVYWSSTPVQFSKDGGKTVGTGTRGLHVDHHAMWWDPENPDHFIVGNDGGIGITWDKGGTFEFVNTIPIGQFYAISYDMAVPYNVCGGLQDNGSWCGPSRRADDGITNKMWATIWGGDGFRTAQDPRDASIVYVESQRGRMGRVDMDNGVRVRLSPESWEEETKGWRDSLALITTLEGLPISDDVTDRVADLEARISADSARYDLRFNWNTPFLLSPHNPDVFYAGGNRVLKSTNRGEDLIPISPDLTYADSVKIRISTETTGGITTDATGAENHATIFALAESPVQQGLLFAGTDDGRVWMSPNDGVTWTELTDRIPGVPQGTWVSVIEPSPHDADRFYVTFDGHRSGDFTPYVFITEDGGQTFRSIAAGLPTGKPDFVHVIREDLVNPNLLFLGTDVGLYMSLDRGATWQPFSEGLPTTPIKDLRIHPRDHELIAGTHGRSIWIVDIAPLQQLGSVNLASGPVFFDPKPALQYGDEPVGGENLGHQAWVSDEIEFGAELTYWIPEAAEPAVGLGSGEQENPQSEIVVLSSAGDTVQTLEGPASSGLHRVYWGLMGEGDPEPLSPSEHRDSIQAAALLIAVADSMIAEGGNEAAIDSVLTMLQSGEIESLFGRRGGGGGGADEWNPRPGESYPEPGEVQEDPEEEEAETEANLEDIARDIFDAVEDRGGEFEFGEDGESYVVDPGQYTVVVKVGPHTMRNSLTVIRASDFTPPPEDDGGQAFENGYEEGEEGEKRDGKWWSGN